MPSNWLLFDRIRALARANRIYQSERIYQDQPDLNRAIIGGEFVNSNRHSAILDQTALQLNRLDRYRDFDTMDQMGEISLALDLYADEACITGDTRIPLLDGTCPTVAELAAKGQDHKFWVYSYDLKRDKYVPAEATAARITGRNCRVLKVTLDDGSSIKCTPEHLFMLKTGEYCQAQHLTAGDSLKPLYKRVRYRDKNGKQLFAEKRTASANAYEFLFNGVNFTSTHRWVYESVNSDHPEVIHHDNYQSLDNTPANLVGMAKADHEALHRRFGSANSSFKTITLDDIRNLLAGWSGPLTRDDVLGIANVGERVLARLLSSAGLTWDEFRNEFNRCKECNQRLNDGKKQCRGCRRRYLAAHHQQKKSCADYRQRRNETKRLSGLIRSRTCTNCQCEKDAAEFKRNNCAYSPYCNGCRDEACSTRYLQKSFANHKVVSVEDCGIAEAVYDITVPEFHCFAAGTDSSWVMIHNSLVDPERKHTLIIRARNRRLKKELEDLFFNVLQWDNQCRPIIRYLCKFGDYAAEIVPDSNRTAVVGLRFVNVYNFTRVETKYGDLVGFYFQDVLSTSPIFLHPWQVMHLRLTTYEPQLHPYGRSILEGGRKAFKQLRLMEDGALIYRLTRAPERRKFYIPVGMISAREVPEYINAVASTFKKQRFYNPVTGMFDERYSPMIQDDDFFLPRRPDGTGPDIDVLPGAENLDQIADIEYFKKKMISPTKIPLARVGIGEGSGQANEKSLSQSHSEFAKAVQWVQRAAATGLTKVALVHLSLRGYSVEDLKGFEIALSSTSAMEELYRIETWQTRVTVMGDLKELGWFPKDWIVTRFTDLTPDELEELRQMEQIQAEGGPGVAPSGILGGGGSPGGDGGPDLMGDLTENNPDDLLAGDEEVPPGQQPPDPNQPPPMAESIDHEAQKQLLSELAAAARNRQRQDIIKTWAQRRGRDLVSEGLEFSVGLEYYLGTNELDGLAKGKQPEVLAEDKMPYDPNGQPGTIVEWSVPKEDRDAALSEVYDAITLSDDETDVISVEPILEQ